MRPWWPACDVNTMAVDAQFVMVDGVRVVAPDSVRLITPYVLAEQQDWFEDELRFLRQVVREGQVVIDIGANHGVYALSLAKRVGPAGRVWAFEPSAETRRRLEAGVAANGFTHVQVEPAAVTDRVGRLRFSTGVQSELNALVRQGDTTTASEEVEATTLDAFCERLDGREVHVVKIDAEGAEESILAGGRRFFAEKSPLIQYEVRAGREGLDTGLVEAFRRLGYRSFRVVPGLSILVPFADTAPDAYLLNLFACKPDRAALLREDGFLVEENLEGKEREPDGAPSGAEDGARAVEATKGAGGDLWRSRLEALPYGRRLANLWGQSAESDQNRRNRVLQALANYFESQNPLHSATTRWGKLQEAFSLLKQVCVEAPTATRRVSLARVAWEYGARVITVDALREVKDDVLRHGRVDLTEPFLVPCRRYESIEPDDKVGRWFLAACVEALEKASVFSSYYTAEASLSRVKLVHDLGFAGDEMRRRQVLISRKLAPRL